MRRPIVRASLVLALTAALAVPVLAGAETASRSGKTTRPPISVPDQAAYGLGGVNETIGAGAVYAAGVDRIAIAIAAEKSRRSARAASPAPTSSPTTPPVGAGRRSDQFTDADFDRVARCETGGRWDHQSTDFDGGLGIYHPNWISDGGRQFAEWGSQATREQQILVGRVHVDRFGTNGWGCESHFYE